MEVLETISGELNNLLSDATHGKEEVVIEKSLHERIVEMFKAGKEKKKKVCIFSLMANGSFLERDHLFSPSRTEILAMANTHSHSVTLESFPSDELRILQIDGAL